MAPIVPSSGQRGMARRTLPGMAEPQRQVTERAGGGALAQLSTGGVSQLSSAIGQRAAAGRGMLDPIQGLLDKSVGMFEDLAVMDADNKLANIDRELRAEMSGKKGGDAKGSSDAILAKYDEMSQDVLAGVFTARSVMGVRKVQQQRGAQLAGATERHESTQTNIWATQTEAAQIANATVSAQGHALARQDNWEDGITAAREKAHWALLTRANRLGWSGETLKAATEREDSNLLRASMVSMLKTGREQDLVALRLLFGGEPDQEITRAKGKPFWMDKDGNALTDQQALDIEVKHIAKGYLAELDSKKQPAPGSPKRYAAAVAKAKSEMVAVDGKAVSVHSQLDLEAAKYKGIDMGMLLAFGNYETGLEHYWKSDGKYGGKKGDLLYGKSYKKGDVKRSPTGATGLFQFTGGTFEKAKAALGLKGDREDPGDNIKAGAWLINDLVTRFKGDVAAAYAAYNAGSNYPTAEKAVAGFIKKRGRGEWDDAKAKILAISGSKVAGGVSEVEPMTIRQVQGTETFVIKGTPGLKGEMLPEHRAELEGLIGRETRRVKINKAVAEAMMDDPTAEKKLSFKDKLDAMRQERGDDPDQEDIARGMHTRNAEQKQAHAVEQDGKLQKVWELQNANKRSIPMDDPRMREILDGADAGTLRSAAASYLQPGKAPADWSAYFKATTDPGWKDKLSRMRKERPGEYESTVVGSMPTTAAKQIAAALDRHDEAEEKGMSAAEASVNKIITTRGNAYVQSLKGLKQSQKRAALSRFVVAVRALVDPHFEVGRIPIKALDEAISNTLNNDIEMTETGYGLKSGFPWIGKVTSVTETKPFWLLTDEERAGQRRAPFREVVADLRDYVAAVRKAAKPEEEEDRRLRDAARQRLIKQKMDTTDRNIKYLVDNWLAAAAADIAAKAAAAAKAAKGM